MIRRTLRALVWIVAALVLIAVGATLYAMSAYRQTWDLPLPATRAVSDPAVIARGRYVVYGPGRYADCRG